jgi:hypothetical protein
MVSRKTRTTVTVVNVGGPETEPTLKKSISYWTNKPIH